MFMLMLLSTIVSLLAVVAFVPAVVWLAHHLGVVDQPGARKIHAVETPRIGGLAIFGGLVAGVLVFVVGSSTYGGKVPQLGGNFFPILVGVTGSFLIGFWDDVFSIGSKRKLVAQILLGCLVYKLGSRITTLSMGAGYTYDLGMFSLPVTVFWIAGVMNAINLIDGLNGLAGGVSVIAFLAIGLFAHIFENHAIMMLAMISAGATLGFLKHNFSPARIFMGDCGSMMLGFLLASLSMSIPKTEGAAIPAYVPLFILAFPLVDTCVAIVRRSLRTMGEEASPDRVRVPVGKMVKQVLSADGDHIHHRLLSYGLSQRQVALLLYAFSLVMGMLAFGAYSLPPELAWIVGVVSIVGVWQLVLALGYEEFAPRQVRMKEDEFTIDRAINQRPSIVRRVRS
jgi:UDP-GlcNAc:undecaprenyl-phosphate GlcNAc-1-phosphate transferase